MILFHSMTEVTVWITVVVFFLLLFALRVNPFRAAGAFVQELFTNRKFLLHFLALIGILFMNKVELILENRMVQKNDFTSDIYRLEGDFVAAVQHLFRSDWLTIASSFFMWWSLPPSWWPHSASTPTRRTISCFTPFVMP
ncbi:hypothetical protein N6H14_19750 [Paenibacillus sp. CC-CFT747]|nr:hypothetical protein N6H14_19750 [Paenibacillus sp. CC-CFT747]